MAEEKMQKPEAGSQKTEDKVQKAEVGSQKTEGKGQKAEGKKGVASMVAQHPLSKKKKEADDLMPVEDLAKESGLKTWETVGLMRASGWAEGKQVTKEGFDAALSSFRDRRQGGGRL